MAGLGVVILWLLVYVTVVLDLILLLLVMLLMLIMIMVADCISTRISVTICISIVQLRSVLDLVLSVILGPLQEEASATHTADSLYDLRCPRLLLICKEPHGDNKLIDRVFGFPAPADESLVWVILLHAATKVSRNGHGVQDVSVLQHIEDVAHAGKLRGNICGAAG